MLPDSQDLVKFNKKKRSNFQRYTPVPDSVLASRPGSEQLTTQISSADGTESTQPNAEAVTMSSADAAGTETITQIGMTRQKLFKSALDRIQENNKIGTTTQLDKEGYMTDLQSLKINSETEINDYKKARALLKAIITSNSKNTSGWIALARVEELDGKI